MMGRWDANDLLFFLMERLIVIVSVAPDPSLQSKDALLALSLPQVCICLDGSASPPTFISEREKFLNHP